MTSGSPVTAQYPARLVRSTGIVNSTRGASGLENVCANRNRSRFVPSSLSSTRYRLPASDCVIRRAWVRINSSSVLRSRSVPRATPMRVSSPISRARCAASPRARAVSARAAASRNPARIATSRRRGLVGWVKNPDRNSVGRLSGTSVSPLRPKATIAPPASTNDRMMSTGKAERLSASSRKTVGRSSVTARSFAWRTGRASTCEVSSAGATASGRHIGGWRRRYLRCSSSRLGPLHPLQAVLRLSVIGEDGDRAVEHLHRLVLLAVIRIEERARVIGQRFGRDLATHVLFRRPPLSLQRGQARVLHEPRRDVADDVEHVITLHPLRLGLHDFSGFRIDQPDVDAEVAVKVDERAHDHVAGADELPDLRGGLRIDATLRAEILLVDQALDFLTLDHARCGILGQLRNHHPGDAALECLEVFLALAV